MSGSTTCPATLPLAQLGKGFVERIDRGQADFPCRPGPVVVLLRDLPECCQRAVVRIDLGRVRDLDLGHIATLQPVGRQRSDHRSRWQATFTARSLWPCDLSSGSRRLRSVRSRTAGSAPRSAGEFQWGPPTHRRIHFHAGR